MPAPVFSDALDLRPFWNSIYMPQIWDILMHTGQKHASDSRQTYAHRAMVCPRFQTDLCTPGINVPQVSGRLLHTMHKRTPSFRQIYAPRAMVCPRFQADLCTPCNDMSQVSGRLLHTRSDISDISDRLLHFKSVMTQNSFIPSENKNELSRNPDIYSGLTRFNSQNELTYQIFMYLCQQIQGYIIIIGTSESYPSTCPSDYETLLRKIL